MYLVDDHGARLDAQYSVEAYGSHLAVIMESRSGKPGRNRDYGPALTLLLARMGALGATLVDALVDSRWTEQRRIPEEHRRLISRPIALPANEIKANALRTKLGEAQARVSENPKKSKGGQTKRIRLCVDVPGYGPDDAMTISQLLARPFEGSDRIEPQVDGRYIYVGDELVSEGNIREALDWLDAHMDSRHETFTSAMKARNNPLAEWSAGRTYKGLKKDAHKIEIRPFLWEKIAEVEVEAAIEFAGAVADGRGQKFAANQEQKAAVEERAMEAARNYYKAEGWEENDNDKDAYKYNPFDLVLNRSDEVKHVEVKGTRQKFNGTSKPDIAVFLTANEVKHARQCQAFIPCQSNELFILTDIEIILDGSGSPRGVGGVPHVRSFSNFDEQHLRPIAYKYIS